MSERTPTVRGEGKWREAERARERDMSMSGGGKNGREGPIYTHSCNDDPH